MYDIEIDSGWIRHAGERFAPSDLDPRYLVFLEWVDGGGEPRYIDVALPWDFTIKKYVDSFTLQTRALESINFQTECQPPLSMIPHRSNGWLVREDWYGVDADGQYTIPVVSIERSWVHDVFGFVTHVDKRMIFFKGDGSEVLVKVFPRQDVRKDAQRIGKERRQYLIDDLQTIVLEKMVMLFSVLPTENPAALIGLPITLPPLSTPSYMREVLEYGRTFIDSMGAHIVSYVNNHTVALLKSHVSSRPEAWLDHPCPDEPSKSIRTIILERIT